MVTLSFVHLQIKYSLRLDSYFQLTVKICRNLYFKAPIELVVLSFIESILYYKNICLKFDLNIIVRYLML